MRLRTTVAAVATTLIGTGAAAVAAGRYASDAALKSSRLRPLPTDPRLTIHSAIDGQITLTRSLASLRPGTYGLEGRGTHAVVGPVLDTVKHRPDSVVRHLGRTTRGVLEPGARVRLTPQVHIGDPHSALGIDYEDVDVPGELGPLPAWFLPGARPTWVITIHGLGTSREHPMIVMPFLHQRRIPVLDLAYRGDPGAPRSPDGIGHFGETEWRDVDAAIRYAVRHGADSVVLYGWSTGATMALIAAARSPLRSRIAGLVLDSPVLDWRATVRALATAGGAPALLRPLVVRAVQGRTGLRATDRVTELSDGEWLSVPVLVLHGPSDAVAPWAASQAFADRRPDLVTLHPVHHAPHAAMWNADPVAYEETLRRFLTPLM